MTDATKAYQAKREEINSQIAKLQAGLEKMDEAQTRNPDDWRYNGNASYINSQLDEAVEFVRFMQVGSLLSEE